LENLPLSDSPFEPIRYRVTEPDIVAGNNLWRRHQIKAWRLILTVVLICIIGLAVLTAMAALDWDTAVAMAAAILVGTAAALMVGKRRSQRTALRYFRQSRAMQEEIAISWSKTHLSLRQNDSYQNSPWTDFRAWAEDDVVIVLFSVGPIFVPIPKRVLTGDQAADIIACLGAAEVLPARLFLL
jgi:hypothetical protein